MEFSLGGQPRIRTNSVTVEDLPTFTVDRLASVAESVTVGGRFQGLVQVKSGWLVYLHVGAGHFLRGRFSEVNAEAATGALLIDAVGGAQLAVGRSYPYLDSYWGERAALVHDQSRAWTLTEFHPRGAVQGQEIIPGGWDHEHCRICWEEIAEYAQRFGYRDAGDDWVCERCYRSYVVPKSLDFITAA